MTKSTITRERLQEIADDGFLKHGESKVLARMALAAMNSEPEYLPLDYLQGHRDGLEWSARLAESNHPETGDWLYDDPIELAKAIRKGPDMPPAQPVADSEPDRNPVLAYADSYRDMAKQGVESVPIWSVITDLERNIAPLYRHAQQPVVDADDNFYSWFGREWQENYQHNQYTTAAKQMLGVMAESAWKAGRRAAMLAVAPHDTHALNSLQSVDSVAGKWIPVSEQMPEDRTQVILWDAEIGEVTSGHYSHKTHTFYHCGDAIENEITHWMPPPCAPQEVK
ncbi:DUF551 domain-containing protein [Klebsiella michiganensis]|uniref:DUF551 domain-containing protein n=1 Tax=Klebsiella michiganensis TaxID=1134687 RepID=UPI00191E7251|nr:DUF551 domain-containing protein [Klebsiella michiganensis]MBL0793353.1 DUF551 domain-containing protein [Klebsiella michiganensis]